MKTRNINTYNPNIDFELSRISNPMVRTHHYIEGNTSRIIIIHNKCASGNSSLELHSSLYSSESLSLFCKNLIFAGFKRFT